MTGRLRRRAVLACSPACCSCSDIGSLLRATTPQEFIGAAAALWLNVQATDFPARAEAIADLVAADRPEVVGLQVGRP